LVKIRQKVYQ